MHAEAPAPAMEPSAHFRHEVAPADGEYVPASQALPSTGTSETEKALLQHIAKSRQSFILGFIRKVLLLKSSAFIPRPRAEELQ